jgi:hypothetical protein
VGTQAPLSENDDLALTPKGPVFRFLGQGRFADVSEQLEETPPRGTQKQPESPAKNASPQKGEKGGVFSKFRKLIE